MESHRDAPSILGVSFRLDARWEPVRGALDSQSSSLDHVGVDHGRADVLVAEEGLDGSDVGAGLE